MAIYHLSVKPVSRSAGRSATGAAAYRAAEKLVDERTGEIHDYRRKAGVESADIVLPDGAPEWATDRAKLWNAAELAEKRKDACVAREFEVALPSELSPAERRRLALDFAKDMANREGCAVDVAIHAPGRGGDNRNHHAHILRTTRKVGPDGLTGKLDTEKAGRNRAADLEAVRARWAELVNARLLEHGHATRVDHRSLEAQGIERRPTVHLGPAASGYERRTGQASELRQREAAARLAQSRAVGELEREAQAAERDQAQQRTERPVSVTPAPVATAAQPTEQARWDAAEKAARAKWQAIPQAEKAAAVAWAVRSLPENQRRDPIGALNKAGVDWLTLLSVTQWHKAVQAERTGWMAEQVEAARKVAADHRIGVLNPHLEREPRLFGKAEWQAKRDTLMRVDVENVARWDRLKAGHYQPDELAKADAEAEQRATQKQPKLAELARVALQKVVEAVQRGYAMLAEELRAERARSVEKTLGQTPKRSGPSR